MTPEGTQQMPDRDERLRELAREMMDHDERELQPSSRTDDFIARTRYEHDEALAIGRRLAAAVPVDTETQK